MSVLATDDFNRANLANLGANWAVMTGGVAIEIISNQANSGSGTGVHHERYTAVAAPNDQYAQCTLKTVSTVTDEGSGPSVRCAAAAQTAYLAQCNTHEIKLYKVVATTFTQLGTDAAAGAANDVIYLEAVGTAITVKKNGTTIIGPITDSAIASGSAGLWEASSATNDQAVDDWSFGDFSGAATRVPYQPYYQSIVTQ